MTTASALFTSNIDEISPFLLHRAGFLAACCPYSNSAWPAREVIGTGRMGPITKQLRQLYFDIVRGRVPKYLNLCTPVYQRTEPVEKR